MADEDENAACKDCETSFVVTVRAKELRREQGFEGLPVRCPACRRGKRERNEANAAGGGGAGGGVDGGRTYEENRVLKKKKSSAAVGSGNDRADFRKGMDPSDARLLRLAREGKMKRAMHRPQEKVELNAYQQRLEASGRALQVRWFQIALFAPSIDVISDVIHFAL